MNKVEKVLGLKKAEASDDDDAEDAAGQESSGSYLAADDANGEALELAGQSVLDAVNSGDANQVGRALKAAFKALR